MDPTRELTGTLPFILMASALLTAPFAFFLLWLYRRAVIRSMGKTGAGAKPASAPPSLGKSPAPTPLRITTIDVDTKVASGTSPRYAAIGRSLRELGLVYVAGGLVYALVFTAIWMSVVVPGGFILSRFAWLTAVYAWPTVLTLIFIAATNSGQRLAILGAYLALLSTIGAYAIARNADVLDWRQLVSFFLIEQAPPTILLLAYLARRVRAVGPLVLVFMIAGVTGALLSVDLAAADKSDVPWWVRVGLSLGLGGYQMFVALHLVGLIPFAVAGWGLLRWIGRRYEAKRMSDQSLTLDAMWLLFGVVGSIGPAFEGWPYFFTGPVAFVAFKGVTWAGFRWLGLQRTSGRTPELLLLRVFSLGARSQKLFDAISKRWLRAGSITLIAGPDLATATVEPHEFLGFVGGRLSRQFVQDEADLRQRLARLDTRPDPDGRYRVNEFFCYADTWQTTMRRLAERSDAVLMDLRTFSRTNQGCLYEIGALLEAVSLARVVFVIDGTTDRAFLEESLQRLWEGLRVEALNRHRPDPQARLLMVVRQSGREVDALLRRLLAEAA
jgi:hypothetical protein